MSWSAMRWAIEQAPVLLTAAGRQNSTAAHVLAVLAYHANNDWLAWPSSERIRLETGLSVSTIRDALAALESGGLIEREDGEQDVRWRLRSEQQRPVPIRVQVAEAVEQRKAANRTRQARRRSGDGAVTPGAGATVTPNAGVTVGDVTPRTGVMSHRETVDVTPGAGVTYIRNEPTTELTDEPAARQAPRKRRGKSAADTEDVAVAFDAFWVVYPRKVGKQDARRAYAKAVRKVAPDKLLAALRVHVAYWQRVGRSPETTPHPATWLNKERWDDQLDGTGAATTTDPRAFLNDCWERGSVTEILSRYASGYTEPSNPGVGPDAYLTDVLVPYNRDWIKANASAIVAAFTREAS